MLYLITHGKMANDSNKTEAIITTEAIDVLRRLNETVYVNHPHCFTVAEESTRSPGVV